MNPLQQAINRVLEGVNLQKLKNSSHHLTLRYREGATLSCEEELIAYLGARLPATYAVLKHILEKVEPGSILDLGAGPGTVWWAAEAAWNQKHSVTAIEREVKFIELGKKLGTEAHWVEGDVTSFNTFEAHDWVVFGYSLGELPEKGLTPLLTKCWEAAQKGILIVEPGTQRGYQRMLVARDHLISLGGSVIAPCPHSKRCPIQHPDWCHFFVRLERSFLHRQAKNASLPFEDEKFSYVIIAKESYPAGPSRIIRPPIRHGGHVVLPLCTPTGLQNITVTRSQKELYKKARKAGWGDAS